MHNTEITRQKQQQKACFPLNCVIVVYLTTFGRKLDLSVTSVVYFQSLFKTRTITHFQMAEQTAAESQLNQRSLWIIRVQRETSVRKMYLVCYVVVKRTPVRQKATNKPLMALNICPGQRMSVGWCVALVLLRWIPACPAPTLHKHKTTLCDFWLLLCLITTPSLK